MTSNNQLHEKQIRDLIENWEVSVRNCDISGAVANHAEDMLIFDVPPPVHSRGIDRYRRMWPPFFDWLTSGGTFEIVWLEVTAGEDVAFATALIRCGRTDELDANSAPNLRLTVGLRREADRWIIVHEHHSLPSTLEDGT